MLSWGHVVGLAAVIGLGLNVRPGALLFIAYMVVVVLYRLQQSGTPDFKSVADAGLRVLAVLVGAVAMGWVAWPWAYAHPIVAPFRALAELGHFGGITPCGIRDARFGVTSLAALGIPASMAIVDEALRIAFQEVFGPLRDAG